MNSQRGLINSSLNKKKVSGLDKYVALPESGILPSVTLPKEKDRLTPSNTEPSGCCCRNISSNFLMPAFAACRIEAACIPA